MDTVRAIHATPWRGVLAMAGGGGALLAELLTVPGASRTVLEAIMPYSYRSFCSFFGGMPEQFCSERTVRQMAMLAWQRAEVYDRDPAGFGSREYVEDAAAFGFAITATLATDWPHRGEHRVYMAFQAADRTISLEMKLEKGVRTRQEEERLVAEAGLALLAYGTGVGGRDALPADAVVREITAPEDWRRLLDPWGGYTVCVQLPEMREVEPLPEVKAVLSGSFAPFHRGHARMRSFASDFLNTDVALELSVRNVDKPPLDYVEIRQRLEQIAEMCPRGLVFLTNRPFFAQKAEIFPNATFLVGADTISRIGDPCYHDGGVEELRRVHAELKKRGCRFLVFGRLSDESFCTLQEMEVPESLREICAEISEADFREDVSSTELRRRGEK